MTISGIQSCEASMFSWETPFHSAGFHVSRESFQKILSHAFVVRVWINGAINDENLESECMGLFDSRTRTCNSQSQMLVWLLADSKEYSDTHSQFTFIRNYFIADYLLFSAKMKINQTQSKSDSHSLIRLDELVVPLEDVLPQGGQLSCRWGLADEDEGDQEGDEFHGEVYETKWLDRLLILQRLAEIYRWETSEKTLRNSTDTKKNMYMNFELKTYC